MRPIENAGPVYGLTYIRVSGAEHQKEGLSLDYQTKATRTYIEQQGWLLHAEYKDVESGAHDDRAGYQQLLSEARRLYKAGKTAAVVVVRLDRFGRDLAEGARARKELRKLGVSQHSIREGGELKSNLHAGMLMLVGQNEREVIAERIADVRGNLVDEGWFYGRCAFGYRLRPATDDEIARGLARRMATAGYLPKVFEPDPLTSGVAIECFERIAAGASVRSVARWLVSLPPALRGNRSWPHQSVEKLLASPTYVGRGPVGDPDVLARPAARWAPLVSDATWQAVQARLSVGLDRPRIYTGAHLLTSMIKCDVCGCSMVATAQRPERGLRRGYRCSGAMRGAKAPVLDCNRTVSMPVADALVIDQVAGLLDALAEPASWPTLQTVWNQDEPGDRDRIGALESEIGACQRRLNDTLRLLADGVIDATAYRSFYSEETARMAGAEAELKRLTGTVITSRRESAQSVYASVGNWSGILRETQDVKARRDVLLHLIKSVVISRGPRQRMYNLDLVYTELGARLAAAAEAIQNAA